MNFNNINKNKSKFLKKEVNDAFFKVKLPSNKKFGYFFVTVFALAAFYFIYRSSGPVGYVFLTISLIIFFVTIFKADLLQPLNKMWMRLGLFLGKIINPFILGIIFFGLFTPYGVSMRIVGRDELRLKKSKKMTYWIKRSDIYPQVNFNRQF